MLFNRDQQRVSKPAPRHLAPYEATERVPRRAARHATGAHRRRLVASTAAVALVCLATVAGREAAASSNGASSDAASNARLHAPTPPGTPVPSATGGETAAASPTASPSKVPAPTGTGKVDPVVKPYLDPKLLMAVPVGPGKVAKPVHRVLDSSGVTTALDTSGIPAVALQAYQQAANAVARSDASCQLPWQLLAAIGRVESDHGRFGGSVLLPDGYGTRPIFGIPLDGRPGVGLIRDTDGGRLDQDPNFDRAVGPMQFIPSTWAQDGVDGNGDGKADPNNIFDATLTAAHYLCASGGNLTDPAQQAAAIRTYNDADDYVRVVMALTASYERGGAATLPTTDTPVNPGTGGNGSAGAPPRGGQDLPVPPVNLPTPPAEPSRTPTQRSKPSATRTSALGRTTPTRSESATPSRTPSQKPSQKPTRTPSQTPSREPSRTPSQTPSQKPTRTPSQAPSQKPATTPSQTPSQKPSQTPSQAPSEKPTEAPSQSQPPSSSPSSSPSSTPSQIPTASATPSTATPSAPAPTGITKPLPKRPAPPRPLVTHNVNVGWAPAMRKVVVGLLTGSAHSEHGVPTHDGQHDHQDNADHKRSGS